jgi:hypothetical protein
MIGPHFAAGVKLLLCDEKDIELFQGHGQGLAAGTHTFIGTKVIVVRRLKSVANTYWSHYAVWLTSVKTEFVRYQYRS